VCEELFSYSQMANLMDAWGLSTLSAVIEDLIWSYPFLDGDRIADSDGEVCSDDSTLDGVVVMNIVGEKGCKLKRHD
jgi:hypothetical protein